MIEIKIKEEYITLGKFLKYVGLISSGSNAKFFLLENKVLVNNEVEQRRGKKLRKEDIVVILNKSYKVLSDVS